MNSLHNHTQNTLKHRSIKSDETRGILNLYHVSEPFCPNENWINHTNLCELTDDLLGNNVTYLHNWNEMFALFGKTKITNDTRYEAPLSCITADMIDEIFLPISVSNASIPMSLSRKKTTQLLKAYFTNPPALIFRLMNTEANSSLGNGLFAKADMSSGTIIDLLIQDNPATSFLSGFKIPSTPFLTSYYMQHMPLSDVAYENRVKEVARIKELDKIQPNSTLRSIIDMLRGSYSNEPLELRSALKKGLPIATANTDLLEFSIYSNYEQTESITMQAVIAIRDIKALEQLGRSYYYKHPLMQNKATIQYFDKRTAAIIPRVVMTRYAVLPRGVSVEHVVIGLLLCAGVIFTINGASILQDTETNVHERTAFFAPYFLAALICFGTAGSTYCNNYGTPKLTFWSYKSPEEKKTTTEPFSSKKIA